MLVGLDKPSVQRPDRESSRDYPSPSGSGREDEMHTSPVFNKSRIENQSLSSIDSPPEYDYATNGFHDGASGLKTVDGPEGYVNISEESEKFVQGKAT